MGDRALEAEILDLLRTQIAAITASLVGADDARRATAAHAMAGSARNVGAFSLANAASRLESEPENAHHLASVEREMARVTLFLRSMQQPI
jgi:HPt (histidine-containing phosphotransfer) domain-containing protein